MKESVVRARIDAELKAQAGDVLAACGLEFSDAIRLFLRQVVLRRGLPFPVRNPGGVSVVKPARFRAMKRAGQARDHAIAAREDLSAGEMFLIRPNLARAAKVNWPAAGLDD